MRFSHLFTNLNRSQQRLAAILGLLLVIATVGIFDPATAVAALHNHNTMLGMAAVGMMGDTVLSVPGARIVDPVLTNLALGYKDPTLIASALFPRVPVGVRGGNVIEFGKEAFKKYVLRRAPGAATTQVQFGYAGKPYALVQDAIDVPVPREYQQEAERVPGINLGQRATRFGMGITLRGLEYDSATLARTAANYDANHKVVLTAGTDSWWDANGDPTGDIQAAVKEIADSVGLDANTVVLSKSAFFAARQNAKITDRFKYTTAESITEEMLARLWDVDRVVVGRAISFDDAGVSTAVWGDDVIVAYVPSNPSMIEEPSFGYTYALDGTPLVEAPYWSDERKSWVYGVTYDRAPQLTGMLAGFLIQNAGTQA